jgi:hypothetical protein
MGLDFWDSAFIKARLCVSKMVKNGFNSFFSVLRVSSRRF